MKQPHDLDIRVSRSSEVKVEGADGKYLHVTFEAAVYDGDPTIHESVVFYVAPRPSTAKGTKVPIRLRIADAVALAEDIGKAVAMRDDVVARVKAAMKEEKL